MPGIAEESQGRKATILSMKEFSSPKMEGLASGPSRITTTIADFESRISVEITGNRNPCIVVCTIDSRRYAIASVERVPDMAMGLRRCLCIWHLANMRLT